MIKKIFLLFFYLIFSLYNSQQNMQLITPLQIDSEIKKAEKLAINNPSKSIQVANEIYHASKKINYQKGMLESINLLMSKYLDFGNYKKVIDLSTEGEKLAVEAKDYAKLANTYRLKGVSYTQLGFNDESIILLKKALKILEKEPSKEKKYYLKAYIYTDIGGYSAHINAPLDSVIYYQNKSLENALLIGNNENFTSRKQALLTLCYINLGMTSVACNRIKDAEKYFDHALKIAQNEKYEIPKTLRVTILSEYAWMYYDQKKYDQAVYYGQKAENLERAINIPYIRRDIYEVNFKSYVELGKKDASKKYMNLYTRLNDSLVNEEKKTINTPVKTIVHEKNQLNTRNIKKFLIIEVIFFLVLFFVILFFWKKNQKKLHDRYTVIITNLKRGNNSNEIGKRLEIPVEKNIGITDETVKMILLKLEKFENSQKFIKKDLSLTSLANDLNTNTRYLSEIIKQYKKSSYSNYINGLRIKYIISKLYLKPVYREYKISYLAEASGFSSREVFAVIFKKETGVSPSYFINTLKKDDQKSIY